MKSKVKRQYHSLDQEQIIRRNTNPHSDYTIRQYHAMLRVDCDLKAALRIARPLWTLSNTQNSMDHKRNWPNLLSLAPEPLQKTTINTFFESNIKIQCYPTTKKWEFFTHLLTNICCLIIFVH